MTVSVTTAGVWEESLSVSWARRVTVMPVMSPLKFGGGVIVMAGRVTPPAKERATVPQTPTATP
ncbi:MAG TPA: hypothetical protein PK349_13785, partial [Candidatus Hydrogenedentes bacterium]|nr:hypothetical protein [Candidatus Hydrogenedentota bacterium]